MDAVGFAAGPEVEEENRWAGEGVGGDRRPVQHVPGGFENAGYMRETVQDDTEAAVGEKRRGGQEPPHLVGRSVLR